MAWWWRVWAPDKFVVVAAVEAEEGVVAVGDAFADRVCFFAVANGDGFVFCRRLRWFHIDMGDADICCRWVVQSGI